MKKWMVVLLTVAALLSACAQVPGAGGEGEPLNFPGTRWDMNVEEVMAAYDLEESDVTYSDAERAQAFAISDRDVLGARATTVSFSFINLEGQDLQTFDPQTMDGKEVLAMVTVLYPAGTDMAPVVAELERLYPDNAREEVWRFPVYMALDSEALQGQNDKASDSCKLWGSDTVAERIGEKNAAFFRENWPRYLPCVTEETWEEFSQKARLVTAVCYTDDQAPYLQFDAYPLAVYNVLEAQRAEG